MPARKSVVRSLFSLAILVVSLTMASPASAGTKCDVRVSAPADLQARLDSAGRGATVCLSGVFGTDVPISPRSGQTIIGGTLTYTGKYDLCWPCGLTDGYRIERRNVTLRHVEVDGFEGHGVRCFDGTTVRSSYVHDNKESGIACATGFEDWHLRIVGNRVVNNGSPIFEFHSASGIKILSLSKPGHCLTCGAIIRNNVSAHNYGNGIWLDGSSSGATIRGNTTFDDTHFGIRCEKCAGPVLIEGNDSYGNDYPGYAVRNSAMVTLRNNRSHANQTHHFAQSGLVVTYASKDTKTWPEVGDQNQGYHPYRIRVHDTRLFKDGVEGCTTGKVTCWR